MAEYLDEVLTESGVMRAAAPPCNDAGAKALPRTAADEARRARAREALARIAARRGAK